MDIWLALKTVQGILQMIFLLVYNISLDSTWFTMTSNLSISLTVITDTNEKLFSVLLLSLSLQIKFGTYWKKQKMLTAKANSKLQW